MLITLAWIPVTPLGALVGFLIFRVLDVVKPWPARQFEVAARRPGHHGRRRDGGGLRSPAAARARVRRAGRVAGLMAAAPSVLARAAIVAVGSELLETTRLDTNSLFITEQLNGAGIDVVFKSVAGDDRAVLGARAALRARGRRPAWWCAAGSVRPTTT